MIVLILLVVAVGGLVEIVPCSSRSPPPSRLKGIKPLHPLQLVGRDIYIREGCYNCHSLQMIRPFRAETLRYWPLFGGGEFVYDHPSSGAASAPARPAPRGRQVQRRLAPHPPDQPARRGARVQHAGLSVAGKTAIDRPTAHGSHEGALRTVGVPYTDADIAKSAGRREGQERNGRAWWPICRSWAAPASKGATTMDINTPADCGHAGLTFGDLHRHRGLGLVRAATSGFEEAARPPLSWV